MKHYKAFISYRHLPLDLKVARKLHRTIEHYVIPKQLRRDGQKKIGYVFRDQDELPISSDLSGSIRTALDNSDYLIVICSPDTAKSGWVLEEISYFIKTHDRDHVLAVLIKGEPYESFPSQLTEPVLDEDGTVRNIEPLAANIVADSDIKRNRLFSSEVLRILAVLIGCTYDDLYKREQRYRMRRVTAVLASVLVILGSFIGVLLNRNAEISRNYDRALRNQSTYLAAESIRCLESYDRFSSLRLALYALPSEDEPDRPVVSKAVYAMHQASLSYMPDYTEYYVASIAQSSDIKFFTLSEDRSLIYIYTEDGVFSVWDAGSYKCLWSYIPREMVPETEGSGKSNSFSKYLILRKQDLVIFQYYRNAICLDSRTGDVVWLLDSAIISEMSGIGGSDWQNGFDDIEVSDDERSLLFAMPLGSLVLEPRTGNILRVLPLSKLYEYGTKIWFEGDSFIFRLNDTELMFINSQTGEILHSVQIEKDAGYYHAALLYDPEQNVLLYANQTDGSFVRDDYRNILCAFDTQTGKQLWRWECPENVNYSEPMVCLYSAEGPRAVVFSAGRRVDVLTESRGELIDSTPFSTHMVELTKNDTGAVLGFTAEGEAYVYSNNPPSSIVGWYPFDVSLVDFSRGNSWALPQGSQSIVNARYCYADESWRYFELQDDSDPDFHYGERNVTQDERVPLWGTTGIGYGEYYAYYRAGGLSEPLRSVIFEKYKDGIRADYTFLGASDNEAYFLWEAGKGYGLTVLDLDSGEQTERETGSLPQGLSCFADNGAGQTAALLTEQNGDGTDLYYVALDLRLEVTDRVLIGTFPEDSVGGLCFVSGNRALIAAQNGEKALLLDTAKKKITDVTGLLAGEVSGLFAAEEDLQGRVLWSEPEKAYVIKESDLQLKVIPEKDAEPFSIRSRSGRIKAWFLSPDGKCILTVEPDAYLRRYSVSTGELLSSTYLDGEISEDDYYRVSLQYCDGEDMYLCLNDDLREISCSDWEILNGISNCFGYYRPENIYIGYNYDSDLKEYRLGFFAKRSVEEMIEYSYGILGDWDLPDDTKKRYGIG